MKKIHEIHFMGNGQLRCVHEDNTVTRFDLLSPVINKLMEEGQISKDTVLYIPYCSEPILITDWYDLIEEVKPEKESLNIFNLTKKE